MGHLILELGWSSPFSIVLEIHFQILMNWWYELMEILNFHKQIIWVLFQLVHMWRIVNWSWILKFDLVKTLLFLISCGSRYFDFKTRLAVVIKWLFRSSTLIVIVWFSGLSIRWIKRQILFGLLSLSAEVKNFFLVIRNAYFNLFRTALHGVQSEVFWVRWARYRLALR